MKSNNFNTKEPKHGQVYQYLLGNNTIGRALIHISYPFAIVPGVVSSRLFDSFGDSAQICLTVGAVVAWRTSKRETARLRLQ